MAVTAPTASADANGSPAAAKAQVGAPMATALLTDQYQFCMAYTYWKAGKHAHRAAAVFGLYFRKNPFGGEFTVFAGLEECIFIANFKFTEQDISFLQSGQCVSTMSLFVQAKQEFELDTFWNLIQPPETTPTSNVHNFHIRSLFEVHEYLMESLSRSLSNESGLTSKFLLCMP